jgi:hypothetical protein
VASWLIYLQSWHHHLGTARHSCHYNIGQAAFRTQNITYAKIVPEIVNKKMVKLGGVINYARTKNRRQRTDTEDGRKMGRIPENLGFTL